MRTSWSRKLGVTLRCNETFFHPAWLSHFTSSEAAEYERPLYAGAQETLLGQLQKIQNRVNRGSYASTYDSLQPLNERFDVASMTVFCKYMNLPPSNELSCIVPPFVQRTRQTWRHTARSNYLKDTPRTEYWRKSFIRRCTSIWNDLPGDVIPANPSVYSSKRRFNRHLKPQSFKTRRLNSGISDTSKYLVPWAMNIGIKK